jgi:hypothetical protein
MVINLKNCFSECYKVFINKLFVKIYLISSNSCLHLSDPPGSVLV